MILRPENLKYDNTKRPLSASGEITDGVIYPTITNHSGIDGFVRFNTASGKHLWILLQVKSAGSQCYFSKRGAARYTPAILEFYSFRNQVAAENANAILIFILQQDIPKSLQQVPNFPESGVYAIPLSRMKDFIPQAISHRLTVPPPKAANFIPCCSQRPISSSRKKTK